VFEGNAKIKDFPGNYSQWKDYSDAREQQKRSLSTEKETIREKPRSEKKKGLNFKERQELQQLEQDLSALEEEKSGIESAFNDSSLSHEELTKKSERMGEILRLIDQKSDRWIELSDMA
jgi:ATP-binding cassette subfamily F protein uup